jgi:hypothetical protein
MAVPGNGSYDLIGTFQARIKSNWHKTICARGVFCQQSGVTWQEIKWLGSTKVCFWLDLMLVG